MLATKVSCSGDVIADDMIDVRQSGDHPAEKPMRLLTVIVGRVEPGRVEPGSVRTGIKLLFSPSG